MINALKKNPALYIGLGLPILMMLIFTGIPFIASFLVAPPKYNFIYSSRSYRSHETLRVDSGKLTVDIYNEFDKPWPAPNLDLYLVDVHAKRVTKLKYGVSNPEALMIPPHETRSFIVDGITLKSLDVSVEAPDGYKVTSNYNDFSFPFFFGGNRRDYLTLSKSGRVDRIPTRDEGAWSVSFEGWVIPE